VACRSRSQPRSGRAARCNGVLVGLANATPIARGGRASATAPSARTRCGAPGAAGALYSAPGAYYLAGLALLAKQNASVTTIVVVLLGFNLIQFALIELPLIGLLVVPTAPALDRETQRLDDGSSTDRDCRPGRVIGASLLISGIGDLS
jgi:hypothetical protein